MPDVEQIIAMVRFIDFLMVGLGGAAGSMLRYGVTLLCSAIGFQCCGGFTTFSTFSMQNVKLLQDGKIGLALVYIIATVTVCVFMAWLGYRLGQSR